jgi:hypothetical protein
MMPRPNDAAWGRPVIPLGAAMAGIPLAIDTDSEDVAWALQTAEALWRRDERLDAVVWLRRAAQAASDAEDDDRALMLARNAAELVEWVTREPARNAVVPHPPTRDAADAPGPSDIDRDDEITSPHVGSTPPPAGPTAQPRPLDPVVPGLSSRLPLQMTSLVPTLRAPSHSPSLPPSLRPTGVPAALTPSREGAPVLTAAEAHAGMLDPWADGEGARAARGSASAEVRERAPLPRPSRRPPREADEVVTSAPPVARGELANVVALRPWPEEVLRSLARDATVRRLGRDEEVSGFALAVVLEGSVDVAATIVDAAAERLHAGAVLRGRGTIDAIAPLRLIACADEARVATWNERHVADAFRSNAPLERELRGAGNRVQALVGVTLGPLGDRLDSALRTEVTNRLRLAFIAENEILAKAGEPIPGLVVVGTGELELFGRSGAPEGIPLRSGDFLFPTEVLRAAPAPTSVRGAKGGALILVADRAAAQELLVTCPPLLEIFAGS